MSRRYWNILFRTLHIGVTGVLVGGHVFNQPREILLPWLYASIASGAVLTLLEAYPGRPWIYQGRGVMVLTKLVLLGLIPWFWDLRCWILAVVIALASIGSHMPARFRYYSLLHRRVLDGH